MSRLLGAFLLAASLASAQVDWNSVTVTASRNPSAPPDQAVLNVSVQSGPDKNLADILNAVQGSGLTAANFTGIQQPYGFSILPQPAVAWNFQLTVPMAQLKDATAALNALEQKLAQAGGGLSLSFSQSAAVSPQSLMCNPADLLADARAQAQKLAGAAGLTPGVILSLAASTFDSSFSCSLTARFALGLMFGQTAPQTISITASRANTTPSDQAVFTLAVTSGTQAGLDTIAAALTGSGIIGAAFAGADSMLVENGTPALRWLFGWTAPIANLKDAFATLAAAQQTIAKANSGLALSYSISGSQISPALQQAQSCSQADLLADAQAQAHKLAAAAGATVGPILSLSDGQGAPAYGAVGYAVPRLLNSMVSNLTFYTATYCTVAVQYQLVH